MSTLLCRQRNVTNRIRGKSRDVLLSFMGHLNMRMLSSNACETPLLAEDEWDEEVVPAKYKAILVPITPQQRLYFLENCKLAVIGKAGPPPSLTIRFRETNSHPKRRNACQRSGTSETAAQLR